MHFLLYLEGLLEKEDLSTRIGKLASRIDVTKAEVYGAVQDKYVDFKPTLNKTQDLSGRVTQLSTDTQSLTNRIKVSIGQYIFVPQSKNVVCAF